MTLHQSLASKLASKAAELMNDPNAKPLSAEDTTPASTISLQEALDGTYNPQPFMASARPSAEAPEGSYLALRLPYLILRTGAKVLPTFGYFVPKDQEQFDLLEYFADQNQGLVERV